MVIGLKLVLGFIGVLTLGIGGVGVMNIMFVSVQERTREIGIRKALGAKRRHILLQFLLEGVATSFIGGARRRGRLDRAGLGVQPAPVPVRAARRHDAGRSTSTWRCRSSCSATCTLLLMLVGLVAGLVPAIRASRLDPIEALRYE